LTHAFTARGCVFKEITLFGSNQGNYFEYATACSERMLKTTVAIQLYECFSLKHYKALKHKLLVKKHQNYIFLKSYDTLSTLLEYQVLFEWLLCCLF